VDEGQWIEGKLSGQCRRYHPDSYVTIGEFRDGKIWQGVGIKRLEGGQLLQRRYENGAPIDEETGQPVVKWWNRYVDPRKKAKAGAEEFVAEVGDVVLDADSTEGLVAEGRSRSEAVLEGEASEPAGEQQPAEGELGDPSETAAAAGDSQNRS
jgi:hypothetical protein